MHTYTETDIGLLARSEARAHAKAGGGGRATGVHWSLIVGDSGASLEIAYVANRPDGNCGIYRTRVDLAASTAAAAVRYQRRNAGHAPEPDMGDAIDHARTPNGCACGAADCPGVA